MAARLKDKPDGSRDGQVHQLFTISGRPDAPGCNIPQENWPAQEAQKQDLLNFLRSLGTPARW